MGGVGLETVDGPIPTEPSAVDTDDLRPAFGGDPARAVVELLCGLGAAPPDDEDGGGFFSHRAFLLLLRALTIFFP